MRRLKYRNLSAIKIFIGMIFEAGRSVIKKRITEKPICLYLFAIFIVPKIKKAIIPKDKITYGSLIDLAIGNVR